MSENSISQAMQNVDAEMLKIIHEAGDTTTRAPRPILPAPGITTRHGPTMSEVQKRLQGLIENARRIESGIAGNLNQLTGISVPAAVPEGAENPGPAPAQGALSRLNDQINVLERVIARMDTTHKGMMAYLS